MSDIQHKGRFAEIERMMSDYFNYHLAPVMRSVQSDLGNKQAEELREYATSTAGILSSMASAQYPLSDPYQTIRVTGEWNSKTTEDYLEMCKEQIVGNKDMQSDLALLADEWRTAVVGEIGRERYDALSEQLGCDLSYAYLNHRMEQLMIEKLVKDRMPKSSAEYIMRKAAQHSIFGLEYELSKSPLAAEIEARGEAAYKPSKWEKGTGMAIGIGVDAVTMGGAGGWGSLARFVGVDLAITAVASLSDNEKTQTPSVESCISKGVFGSDKNLFDGFRNQAKAIKVADNDFIGRTNNRLKKKIPIFKFNVMDWSNPPQQTFSFLPDFRSERDKNPERYKDVPLIVAPGQEEAYLQEKARQEAQSSENAERESNDEALSAESESLEADNEAGSSVEPSEESQRETPQETPEHSNANGWDGLLGALGLEGMGNVAGNLGYVMAMLPDVLLGLFTGKTTSFGIKDSLLPIASIVAGMFVRNPMLKMLLIGLGGANLLNKTGHEALQQREQEKIGRTDSAGSVSYKRYADEPLDPRIVNPVLQGNTLIATIDRIPCTIQLPPSVSEAYHARALPLNTLANAVLAKSDRLRQAAAQNYDNGQHETLIRSRGIQ